MFRGKVHEEMNMVHDNSRGKSRTSKKKKAIKEKIEDIRHTGRLVHLVCEDIEGAAPLTRCIPISFDSFNLHYYNQLFIVEHIASIIKRLL